MRNDGAANTANKLASEAGKRQRRAREHRREPRSSAFLNTHIPQLRGRRNTGGTSATPAAPARRLPAGPPPSWTACRKHSTGRPGPPSPRGSSPTSRAAGPASASPSCAIAEGSATSLPPCPATANPRRSCACATRDQPTAGPSESTWPAPASTPSPNCPPPPGPRPPPKKGSMTPSSSTRGPELATGGAQPAPGTTPGP